MCRSYYSSESIFRLFQNELIKKYGKDVSFYEVEHKEILKFVRLSNNSIPYEDRKFLEEVVLKELI